MSAVYPNVTRARIALILAVAAPLTACGGSGTQPAQPVAHAKTVKAVATPTPRVTHAQFIAALDKTCVQPASYTKHQAAFQAGLDKGDFIGAADELKTMIPVAERANRRRARLTAPAADRTEFRRYMAAQDRLIRYSRLVQKALAQVDYVKVLALKDGLETVNRQRERAAKALGSRNCGKS